MHARPEINVDEQEVKVERKKGRVEAVEGKSMEARAVAALQRTWQVIAFDSLQATKEYYGRDYMTRDEVMDGVASCGFVGGYPEMYGQDADAVVWLDRQSQKTQDDMLKRAFPSARYGM